MLPSIAYGYSMSHTTYAGFWVRTLALLIDSIWTSIICIPFIWIVVNNLDSFSSSSTQTQIIELSINLIISAAVVMAFWLWVSATPGKLLFNIKIVDAHTLGPLTKNQIVIRYLAYYINIIPLFLGFIWVAKDKQKRGFHDIIAKTVVIIEKPKIILE